MKRVLYVANPFPPTASGGNARHLRFLRYLPAYGWEATVLAVRTAGPVPDPPDVRIERARRLDPERLYGLAGGSPAPMRGRRPAGDAAGRRAGRGGVRRRAIGSHAARRRAGRRGHRSGAHDEVPAHQPARPSNDWLQVPDAYVELGAAGGGARPPTAARTSASTPSSRATRGARAHLVAAALAGGSGLPWVADYRDPWRTNQFRRYPTRCARSR